LYNTNTFAGRDGAQFQYPAHQERKFRETHEALSKKMGELEGTFRALKARLFQYAEEALKHEKMKMLTS